MCQKLSGFIHISCMALVALHLQSHPAAAQICPRVNKTAEQLVECIQQSNLWQHMVDFQSIADKNPGQNGHGNRDTGTTGYKASVDYVAGLMKQAGYTVTVQTYKYATSNVIGTPTLSLGGRTYAADSELIPARLTAGGSVNAAVSTVKGSGTGCAPKEFKNFQQGRVALLQRGACAYDAQVAQAVRAGASAVVLFRADAAQTGGKSGDRAADEAGILRPRLSRPASIPVVALASNAAAADFLSRLAAAPASIAHLSVATKPISSLDYNLIAESTTGDPNHVVVVDAHLDSIYGAGMLDNASGSSTILEIALQMAQTPARNRMRYIWFGGEELGLLGWSYYTTHLTKAERDKIAFDIDVDVTATPNFDYLVADPKNASNVNQFPQNVVPQSKVGTEAFLSYFKSIATPALPAGFGNDGTDSNSFSLIGIPNTGILTNQDCCKANWEVKRWGGYLGNYEGKIPSFNGGCVDNPGRWCDNLSNNDPAVMEKASQAAAYVVFRIANHNFSAAAAAEKP